ncbi:hypothetical protein M5E87_02145 [Flavonifractor plautii]|nr:hypothetical protein M5E87_02145 [Flavonifractor plautii]
MPTLSKVTGELSIMVAAPVWLNGIEGGTVAGVVYFVPHETFLNDIMESIHISENSGAYMIDSTGTTIADTTLDTVSVQNIEQEAQQDSSLSALAALHADMRAGNSGYGSYEISGAQKYLAYAPVPQTDGWTVAVTAPVKDFLGTTYTSTLLTAILLIVILVIAILLAVRMAGEIGNPIRACAERLQLLEQGDLSSPVPTYERRDEIGVLSLTTRQITTRLQELIGDIGYLLGRWPTGTLMSVRGIMTSTRATIRISWPPCATSTATSVTRFSKSIWPRTRFPPAPSRYPPARRRSHRAPRSRPARWRSSPLPYPRSTAQPGKMPRPPPRSRKSPAWLAKR